MSLDAFLRTGVGILEDAGVPYMEEVDRRREARLLGADVFIATAEDLLLAKLEWAGIGDSAIQRRDALSLLRAQPVSRRTTALAFPAPASSSPSPPCRPIAP